MATITWKGGEGAGPDDEGPKILNWGGKTFKKGEALDVGDDFPMIDKAANNPNFEVSGYEVPAQEDIVTDPKLWKPPSQQATQGPVPKAGEPVKPGVPESAPQATRSIPKV